MTLYYRPLVQTDVHRPDGAFALAGGWCWFTHVAVMSRDRAAQRVSARDIPNDVLDRLTSPRAAIAGLSMAEPQVMGIINATPDSFSDGGDHFDPADAVAKALAMVDHGATILDIGGESTRPGAVEVSVLDETARVGRVIDGIAQASDAVISIDTRKAAVARDAIAKGATLINDVTAFEFDADMADVAVQSNAAVCLMHSIGTPETMQAQARYDDVLFDVFDHLQARVTFSVSQGVKHENITIDPGIGFGKTLEHNLILLQNLSLFHALGCPILLGASRKRFIGTLGHAPEPKDRLGGSLAVALQGINQGVQILRVHDTYATKQAINLQMAMIKKDRHGT